MTIVEEFPHSVATASNRVEAKTPRSELVIKPVNRQHEAELKRILLGLDPQSRLSRFATVANDEQIIGHLNSVCTHASLLIGGFVESCLRGFVEIYDVTPLGFAEAAFIVELEWRGRGIGSELLYEALLLPRKDVPGLRTEKNQVQFPLNGPELPDDATPIELGKLIGAGGVEVGTYAFDLNGLVRHGLLVGTTGSGKSTTCRRLIPGGRSARSSLPHHRAGEG
jgi:hypothetical protein